MLFVLLVDSCFPHVTDDLLLHMVLITDWIERGKCFRKITSDS